MENLMSKFSKDFGGKFDVVTTNAEYHSTMEGGLTSYVWGWENLRTCSGGEGSKGSGVIADIKVITETVGTKMSGVRGWYGSGSR